VRYDLRDAEHGDRSGFQACAASSNGAGDFFLSTARVQPGIIATAPLAERAEVSGAMRAHIFVHEAGYFAVGYSIGLGQRKSGAKKERGL
jgi:hypothetical protein